MIRGFIAKSLLSCSNSFDNDDALHLYSKKGKEIQWHQDDYPPVEVIVLESEKMAEAVKELRHIIKRTDKMDSGIAEDLNYSATVALDILEGRD